MPLAASVAVAVVVLVLGTSVAGCSDETAERSWAGTPPAGAEAVPLEHARTFSVYERNGYRIVDVQSRIVRWGEAGADGPEMRARVVLAPHSMEAPRLEGDLAGATLIRTPIQRVAVNLESLEAMLEVIGALDRIVAVGGVKSWNDDLRARARRGEVAQIGYGWHYPPELDALLAARPDVLVMSLGDSDHTQHYDRIRSLSVPVLPVFVDNEVHPLGQVEHVLLLGMLLGEEEVAEAFVTEVTAEFQRLAELAAGETTRTAMMAWFAGGDRWMVAVRNVLATLLREANAYNPFEAEDDPARNQYTRVGTEVILERGRDVDCWIARDTHSRPFTRTDTLAEFRAYREGCFYALAGRVNPEADAWDWYFHGVIRPDWVLNDLVRMLHPDLPTAPFYYLRPELSEP